MKKTFLLSASLLIAQLAFGQTTGTYVVTDNPNRMTSCQDTLVTFADIYERTGIRDLNDPNDNVSLYRMLRLNGSLITNEVIEGPIKYTDYQNVYVEKTNTAFNGHNGVVIYFNILQPPVGFFLKDTLAYTIEKGAKVNYSKDFFGNLDFWSSGFDTETLDKRIIFVDEVNHINRPIGQDDWNVGKGTYKIKIKAAVCGANDLFWDSLSIIVAETPCSHISIKGLPSACKQEILNITPYVEVDGAVASPTQLAAMTFWDRSNVYSQASGSMLDPTSIDMAQMLNAIDHSPAIEIAYQPNKDLGVCTNYSYRLATKVPTNFITTNLVLVKDNGGALNTYQIDGDYYGFNGTMKKDVLNKLYLDYYDIFKGTYFKYYSDKQFAHLATGSTLSPGEYTVVAVHPDCESDSSVFHINVKDRDFDIVWQGAQNQGKGYYTFNVPEYIGAEYTWFVWGGSIVSGLKTREIIVYFSQNASSSVTVRCSINIPAQTRLEGNTSGSLSSALYLAVQDQNLNEGIVLDHKVKAYGQLGLTVYPNPATDAFVVAGNGVYEMKVYNALGQMEQYEASYQANTPVQVRGKGLYMVHLIQNEVVQILKVMIQ